MPALINPNYTVGKGKLYFDRFPSPTVFVGSGAIYLGNTPSFSLAATSTDLKHFSSEGGVKVIDQAALIQTDFSGKFDIDNMSDDAVAMWTLGGKTLVTQSSGSAVAMAPITPIGGRYYQVGTSPTNPEGARDLSAITAKIGATAVTDDGTNFTYDLVSGLVYIVPGGTLDATPNVILGYTPAAASFGFVDSGSTPVYGAMRFIANNPAGQNRNLFMPLVMLSPASDWALKGDTWMALNFTVNVLKLNPTTPQVRAYYS